MKPRAALWSILAIPALGLAAFSQSGVIIGDEGFYLLAAQLVHAGKRPFVDFFYPHTPLFLYVYALWMEFFGESWRSAHLFSGLLTGSATALVGYIVSSRLQGLGWRLGLTVVAVLLMASSVVTVLYGTIALPYALALFLTVVAFFLTVKTADRPSGFQTFLAGLFAGGAVASTLLTAPIVPVLGIWTMRFARSGTRLQRFGQFCLGVSMPFLLVLWLAIQGPRQVLFDLVEFHLFYRRIASGWTPEMHSAWRFDLRVLTSWLQSTQGLLLALLSTLGALFIRECEELDRRSKSDLYLCVWLSVALGTFAAVAHRTFQQYFIFLIPFLSILASIGVYAISSRILTRLPKGVVVFVVAAIFMLEDVKMLRYYDLLPFHPNTAWYQVDEIANAVNRRVSRAETVYADEATYFAGRIPPPSGLENSFATSIPISATLSTQLHVVPEAQIDSWLRSGHFAAVVMAVSDPRVISLDLHSLYLHEERISNTFVFWDRRQ